MVVVVVVAAAVVFHYDFHAALPSFRSLVERDGVWHLDFEIRCFSLTHGRSQFVMCSTGEVTNPERQSKAQCNLDEKPISYVKLGLVHEALSSASWSLA